MFDSMLIVGCGNMAGAMIEGWLNAGFDPARFTLVDPARTEGPRGLPVLTELPQSGEFDAILLAFKPQQLAQAAPPIAALSGGGTSIFSLLAGVELATLAERFPQAGALVRVMPNLAAALGKAPVALSQQGLDEAACAQVVRLFAPLGMPEWVGEEDFDLVTALAGSGPAFVYRFIDALGAGAIRLGLGEAQARSLALAMVEGAAALAARSEHSPGALADMVASKGGVTRAGLDVLDDGEALTHLVEHCLRTARERSAEMAREARE